MLLSRNSGVSGYVALRSRWSGRTFTVRRQGQALRALRGLDGIACKDGANGGYAAADALPNNGGYAANPLPMCGTGRGMQTGRMPDVYLIRVPPARSLRTRRRRHRAAP